MFTLKQYTINKQLSTESGGVKIRTFVTRCQQFKSVSNIRAFQFVLDFHVFDLH